MLKNIFIFVSIVVPSILFGAQTPDIFYQTAGTPAQIGVIRNFDDDQVKILYDNISSPVLPATVHPGSGRYAFWVYGSSFENFEFGIFGKRLIFGSIAKGTLGWTVPATNYSGKDYMESRPRFSLDGSKVLSTSSFRYNTFINSYDFQTGASEPLFFNRWPRAYNKGLPSAALSRDEKKVVFSALRYRWLELYTWPVVPAQNDVPAFVVRSGEVPFDLYGGKEFIVYKTFRELRYRMRRTVLHLYDFKIVEHYEIFEYPDVATGGTEPAGQDYVIDEKNRVLYTAVHSAEMNGIYRVSLKTLKVDPLFPKALRVYDVTRDGRYLLFTKYRDEAELVTKSAVPNDNPVIAVYDLQTKEVKEMSVDGAAGYETLSFVYRD